MKALLPMLTGAMVAAGWALAPASAQTIPAAPKAAAPTAPSSDAAAPYILSIQQATDPSALITAYANGFAADRTSIKLHEAYISRMIDFGMPEMAYHQAELAATLDPRNGLVRGVLAYVNAKRGLMGEALSEIVQAADLSPDQPFVQRTAGELLAWYDRNFLDLKIADATKLALDNARKALASRAPFAQAYDDARKALADQAAAAAGKTATPASSSAAPAPSSQSTGGNAPASDATYADLPPDAFVYTTGGTLYSYVPPPADYPPMYYPDYYSWPAPWWCPSGVFFGSPFFLFFDADRHRRHDRDFDGHHDHDFAASGGAWGGRGAHLFGPRLSAQQHLHAAVASVRPIGSGIVGGAGLAGVTGPAGGGHEGAFHGQVARAGGAAGTSPAGTVFLAVNGRVISTAHGDGHGVGPFTSGNLEPSSFQGSQAGLQGSGSTRHAENSSSPPPGVNPPHVMSTGAVFTGTSGSHSFAAHAAHVTTWSGGGGGASRFTALPGGHVSTNSAGGHFASGFSGGGGGARFTASTGGHGSFAPSGGHFTSGFSGGNGGGHSGGGHR